MRVGAVGNRGLCGFPSRGGRVLGVHGAGSVHARRCILRRRGGEAIVVEDRELVHRQFPVVRGRAPHVAVMLRSASQISLVAASSVGKWPRVLMILRSAR